MTTVYLTKYPSIPEVIDGFTLSEKNICTEYDIVVNKKDIYAPPERAVDIYEVAGGEGNLIVDKGYYKNVKISYDIEIYDDFETNYANFLAYLRSINAFGGYIFIRDSVTSGFYRIGILEPFSVDKTRKTGKIKLTFNCKPYRYYTSGFERIAIIGADSETLTNPDAALSANPLIAVASQTGSFSYTLTINTVDYTISGNIPSGATAFTLDCERKCLFDGTLSLKNDFIDFSAFPSLPVGQSTIVTTGSAGVYPRWRSL